jgi:DNA polymerase-1
MKVLIDADSIIYIAAAQKKGEKYKTLKKAKKQVDSIIDTIMSKTRGSEYLVVLTLSRCFRYNIFPEYKIHRKKLEKPEHFDAIKAYIIKKYRAFSVDTLEADDVVRVLSKQIQDSIIASPDKDILQLKGTHFNYKSNLFHTTTELEASTYFWNNMITGQSGDGIKGIAGKGPAYAKNLFNETMLNGDMRSIVFHEYIKAYGEYKGIEEFYKNYKCLYILEEFGIPIPEFITYKHKDLWEIEENI